jgi:hypothetical protein
MEHVMPNKFYDPYDIEVKDEVLNAQNVYMPNIDGLQLLNANIVNQNASGSGNDLAANKSQINNLVDNDSVSFASVSFYGANGGNGYDATGADFNVDGCATSGPATADHNIAAVGQDGTISDAANATSSAAGSAAAFSQSIDTGGNTQANSSTIDFEGGISTSGGYPNGGWVFPEKHHGKDDYQKDDFKHGGHHQDLAKVLQDQPLHNGIELKDDLINARNMTVGELDGLQVLTANVVNQDVSGPGNDVALNVNQMNNGVDNNSVYNPSVSYTGGNGGNADYARGGDVIVKADGHAEAAYSHDNNAQVYDDGSISNAANATSSGSALGQAFTQSINTNADTQSNASAMYLDGGNSVGSQNNPATYGHALDIDDNLIDAKYLSVYNLDGIQLIDGTLVNQRVSGSGNDVAINLHQTNNLVGNDTVTDPSVSYGATPALTTVSDGKCYDPSAEYARGGNFEVTADASSSGAESAYNTAHVWGDGSISNAGNAVSSASASAEAFTQTISTGGNLQVNQSRIFTHGGESEGNNGPAGHQRDEMTLDSENVNAANLHVDYLNGAQMLKGDAVNQNGTGGGNDTVANLAQMNNLVDNDSVKDPSIRYFGGNGGSDFGTTGGSFTLIATATAATAFSHNNAANVDGSGSISGAGNATSSASANAEAFVQTIDTGTNTQANTSTAVIEPGVAFAKAPDDSGGDDGCVPCRDPKPSEDSHDCDGPSVCDDQQVPYHDPAITTNADVVDAQCLSVSDLQGIQFLDGHLTNQDVTGAGNDTAFNIDQINNMVDNDSITCPSVSYQGGNGGFPDCYNGYAGSGGDFTLKATAYSGEAHTAYNTAQIGYDGSISGAGSATSAATAHADAFSQNISMGANLQINTSTLDVLGGTDHHV